MCSAASLRHVLLSPVSTGMVFAGLYALAPNVLDALKIVKPDTVIRWHRAGFRAYWRWRSRSRGGRPGPSRNSQVDPRDEHRQSTLGRAAHPRRIAQAWPLIPLLSGSLGNSPRRSAGEMRRARWCAIGIVSTGAISSDAFVPWAFGIGRSRPVRPGRMDMRRG